MQEICSYIEENLGGDLSVQRVADYAGMERSYFSKLFKKTFRMSPRQYIYAKRMNCAAELIIQGKRIKEACRRVGYTDEKAFSRAFKQYMEMSPGEYGKKDTLNEQEAQSGRCCHGCFPSGAGGERDSGIYGSDGRHHACGADF